MQTLIDLLNNYIRSLTTLEGKAVLPGIFILHKQIIPRPTFPAYKEYRVVIWYIYNNKKVKWLILNTVFKSENKEEAEGNLLTKLGMQIFEDLHTHFNTTIQTLNFETEYETT